MMQAVCSRCRSSTSFSVQNSRVQNAQTAARSQRWSRNRQIHDNIKPYRKKNTIGQAVSQLGSAASLLRFSQKTTLQAAGVQTESAGIVLFVLPALLETVDP
ncbi:hypothetical protein [Neisseria musculi]|uniref:hypothetical protein n=1 Tax=Neisseria musculi TaxID=1815583 RepID=UPI00336C1563